VTDETTSPTLTEKALLDAWAENDRAAVGRLLSMLGEELLADPPHGIGKATDALAEGLAASAPDFHYVLAACGWPPEIAEDIGEEDWLTALASTIRPFEDPGTDPGEQWAISMIDPSEWLALVVLAVRVGAGTPMQVDAIVEHIRYAFEPATPLSAEDEADIHKAFAAILPRWRNLGVLDAAGNLTRLGAWGLPQALYLTWDRTGDDPSTALSTLAIDRAVADWQKNSSDWTPEQYVSVAGILAVLADIGRVSGFMDERDWDPFLEHVHAETDSADAAYVRGLRADLVGDGTATSRWIEAAVAADPDHRPTLEILAADAGDRGDASLARDLLRRAGVGPDDAELATYVQFAKPPISGPSRNAPCPCGSGRKYKMCCGGQPQHPLAARVPWLWQKVLRFAHRPSQLAGVLQWAEYLQKRAGAGEIAIDEALELPLVLDAAFWDGGLLDRFVARRGPVLPADELALVRQWRATRRGFYEVVDARPGVGLRLLDLTSGDSVKVRRRMTSHEFKRGDLLLARFVPIGTDESMLTLATSVLPADRESLLTAVAAGTPEAVLDWLAAED
jgi:hypothetical protein